MSNNNNNDLSERWSSPSEKMKAVVINRYEKTENLYTEMNDRSFIRSCKALSRSLRQFLTPEQRELLDKLNNEEEKALKEMYEENEGAKDEIIIQERKKVEFEYAEKRMDICAQLINNSSIITKDMEVDFKIPQDPEEIERLQEIIKNPIQREEHTQIR